MKLTNQQKRIWISIVFIITVVIIAICTIYHMIHKEVDVSNALHGVVINNDVDFVYNRGKHLLLAKGDRVYVVSHNILNKTYTVKYENEMGTIDESQVALYQWNNAEKYSLMLDVSEFNAKKEFTSAKDFTFFLLEHPINYVYIRLGGRGWGEAGNWYYDAMPEMFIDVCEYLGVPYGFYFIEEAINEEEVLDEVARVNEFLQEKATSWNVLPLAIDLEYQEGKGRTDNKWDSRIPLLERLLKEFQKQDIDCIVYVNGNRGNQYLSSLDANFWVARYPQENRIPESSYSQYVKYKEMQSFLKKITTESGAIKTSIEDVIFQSEYSDTFFQKVIGWQFTENGASEDGIEDNLDLSIVRNDFFKEYVMKKNVGD